MPLAGVVKQFNNKVTLYAFKNRGSGYDFGYILGMLPSVFSLPLIVGGIFAFFFPESRGSQEISSKEMPLFLLGMLAIPFLSFGYVLGSLIVQVIVVLIAKPAIEIQEILLCVQSDEHGFFRGVWHSMIAPFSFIGSLFSDEILIYSPHGGKPYALGFALYNYWSSYFVLNFRPSK
ncbi:MAG: hypothetical protein RMM53_06650 [Bacteroidia bacterium]|nr:hypothetical protein [Bacteroidia bacterium]